MSSNSTKTPYWRRLESWFIAAAFLILVSTSFMGWLNWRRFSAARIAAEHTRSTQEQTFAVLASVENAEDAQRGYLLTGRDSYLAPYRKSLRELPDQLRTIRNDTPEQKDALIQLQRMVDQKLAELAESINLRRSSGFSSALDTVLTDRGRESMEKIRTLVQRITAAQYRGFQERTLAAEEHASKTLLVNTVGDVILSILLLLSAAAMHRGAKRREELILALQENEHSLKALSWKAEAAEENVRSVLESISDGFMSFDSSGIISYCNAEAARMLNRTQAEMPGKNFWTEFPDGYGEEARTRYREVFQLKRALTFETFLETRKIWLEESVYPSSNGLSVYLRDITARKHFEDRSRHAQKLESLGVLAGGIAHDFNNLLTAILGSASLLMEDLPGDSPLRSFAENVINASERASELTRQMLAYSGRGRFVVELLDLGAQVTEITALVGASITSEVELVLDLKATGVLIEADAGQMQQLIMNLVLNGAEAIDSTGGSVVVSTRVQQLDIDFIEDNMAGDGVTPGDFVLLQVHDTGHGMDADTLARIFDPFFTTKFTGRGLGLAAAHGIVRGHQGALKVLSTPGEGTTFKVFLPVAKGHLVPKVARMPLDFHGTGTVLVVDDEHIVQELARTTLERYGYKVLVASNGKEALHLFQESLEQIAVVLLDMTMPVMSGEETLVQLKQLQPNLRVIASSGYNEVEALRRFGAGIESFLQKPYRGAELAEKVKLVLC